MRTNLGWSMMMDSQNRLLLIEGLPGSGKTSLTEILTPWLAESLQRDVQAYFEVGANPIRKRFLFEDKAHHGQLVESWRLFVADARGDGQIHILESRFWQNTLLQFLARGDEPAELIQLQAQIFAEIRCMQPILIHLQQTDVAAALARITAIRGEAWIEKIVKRDEQLPWHQSRGMKGYTGLLAFFEAWWGVSNDLFEALPMPKLNVVNPQEDYPAALASIQDFLRPDGSFSR